MRHDVILEH